MWPLFEAVVNSIQSIDTNCSDMDKGLIEVEIMREFGGLLEYLPGGRGHAPLLPITGFAIHDNGPGFHDDNLGSFRTLDSEYKAAQGCRGVGRLLWLKAFDRVRIDSVFEDSDGALKRRTFDFTGQDGLANESTTPVEDEPYARVLLEGFKKSYQMASPKMGETIAKGLLEHCLWYFVRKGGAPNIVVRDGGEAFHLNRNYDEYMRSSASATQIPIKGHEFELIHLKLKSGSIAAPHLNWCAANRVVVEENITGKIAGLHGPLRDAEGEFIYAGYLTSDYLDEHVRSERTDFDLFEATPENEVIPGIVTDAELTRSDIRDAVLAHVAAYLSDSLDEAREEGRTRLDEFVSTKAPRYRPILDRIEERGVSIDPKLSDRDLEVELHKRLADFEAEVLVEGQQVLADSVLNLTNEESANRLDEYLAKVEDIKKSDLAAYVSRRKMILDLLAQAIEQGPDGKYAREDLIHNLIMPMRTTSNDALSSKATNLWIVDERLAFHNYLASDKTLKSMPITGSESTKEPDLLALQLTNSPVLIAEGSMPTWASLSIIEIKRPMRNDASAGDDKDPIEQCLGYLRRVRMGGVTTSTGRPIPNANQIPGFCYVIADLTPTLRDRCLMHQLHPTADGMGYFGYHSQFNAYIEVVSFDRLLKVARQRNRAFFDVVGLPVD